MDVDSEDFEVPNSSSVFMTQTSYFTLDFGPDPPQNISSDVGVSFTVRPKLNSVDARDWRLRSRTFRSEIFSSRDDGQS